MRRFLEVGLAGNHRRTAGVPPALAFPNALLRARQGQLPHQTLLSPCPSPASPSPGGVGEGERKEDEECDGWDGAGRVVFVGLETVGRPEGFGDFLQRMSAEDC
jgi:hypothetical protein